MKFSIITVALNPGEKLQKTLDSVFCQTCTDYEVIIKDGGSTDGSMDRWKHDSRVRFFEEPDKGIYDAMNQAVRYAEGEFVLFLNCGDVLADKTILERVSAVIDEGSASGNGPDPRGSAAAEGGAGVRDANIDAPTEEYRERLVIYGDTLSLRTNAAIASSPKITGFTCYRNIPCHQSCFYSADLCRKKPYDLQYKIRADYDHFLWCYYRAGARFLHIDLAVAAYEGGGYSESRENAQRDRSEHRMIVMEYMTSAELLCYRTVMALTLAPLRRKMAEGKLFSGLYHWVKRVMYAGRK